MNQTELGHWGKDPAGAGRGQGLKLKGGMSGPTRGSPLNPPQRRPHAPVKPTITETSERCGWQGKRRGQA